jgi:hypothetical protein
MMVRHFPDVPSFVEGYPSIIKLWICKITFSILEISIASSAVPTPAPPPRLTGPSMLQFRMMIAALVTLSIVSRMANLFN